MSFRMVSAYSGRAGGDLETRPTAHARGDRLRQHSLCRTRRPGRPGHTSLCPAAARQNAAKSTPTPSLETRAQESHMSARFSGVSRDTDQANHTRRLLGSLIRLEPTATGRELWFACTGTGVSTGGRAHSSPPFFTVRTMESNTCVQFFFMRKLGFVFATVIVKVSAMRR